LNPDVQKELLRKSSVYTYIDHIAKDTINGLIGSLPLEDELLNMLADSYMNLDNQVIENGIDSLITGLLEYIKGQSNVLPDIYIGNQLLPEYSTEIDRISLSSMLLYFNKSYLIDMLVVIRQSFQLFKSVPLIICIFILLLTCFGIMLSSTESSFISWLNKFFLSSGITGLCIFIYANRLRKHTSAFDFLLLSFDKEISEIILSYINCLLTYILHSIVIYAGCIFLTSSILYIITKYNKYRYNKYPDLICEKNTNATLNRKINILAGREILIIIILALTASITQNVYHLNKQYQIYNPKASFTSIYKYGSLSGIISAVDDTVYSLELKVNNEKTGQPIPNIKVRVIELGNIAENKICNDANEYNSYIDKEDIFYENTYNDLYTYNHIQTYENNRYMSNEFSFTGTSGIYLEADTDETGTANIILNKGLYKLEISSTDENDYILPESFTVDIKLAGKNTIFLSILPKEE